MGGVSSRDHPTTIAEDRRPGAYHRAKNLDPLCQGLPLEERLRLSLGSSALLRNPLAKNFTPCCAKEGCRAPQAFQQDDSRLAVRSKPNTEHQNKEKMNRFAVKSTIELHLVRKAG